MSSAAAAWKGGGVGGVGGRLRGRVLLLPSLWCLLGAAAVAVPLKGLGPPGERSGRHPPALNAFGGCVYGGAEYTEGEAVATDEQCLNCTCSRGALVCHLRACPPLPKVPGCSAVRKADHACCPSIVCDESRGREIEEMTFGIKANNTGCDVEGKVFKEGTGVPGMAGRCEECYCSGGRVTCARTPCSPAPAGCTPLFAQGGECCPSRYDCPGAPSLALLDIDLGSNLESVLAPPSLEELRYFGAYSTKDVKEEEKESNPTTSTEDTQSATATATNGLQAGDSRKDRHMETSTTATAKEDAEERGRNSSHRQQSQEEPPDRSAGEASNGPSVTEGEEEGKTVKGEGGAEDSLVATTTTDQLPTTVLTTLETEEDAITTTKQPPEGEGEDDAKTEGAEEETTTPEQMTTPLATAEPEATRKEEGGEAEGEGEATEGATTEPTTGGDALDDAQTEAETPGDVANEGDYGFGSADNETAAYSAESNGTAEEVEEMESLSEALDNYSGAGNETVDQDDEQMQNFTSDGDNSTTAVDPLELRDSSKNVSHVLVADDDVGGSGNDSKETEKIAPDGMSVNVSSNETEMGGDFADKSMEEIVAKVEEHSLKENQTEIPASNVTLATEGDHLTTVVSIERKKDVDYEEYDYNEPTLPPSLPNLRIIPFVAADAVLDKDKHKTTEVPIFFDGVPPSLFSPPVETEGGFVPRDPPILEGGLRDVTYKSPVLIDNLSSTQTDMPLIGIAAIELTTTSKPSIQGDFGLQSLVANGTLGSGALDSLYPPTDHLQPEKGMHTLLSPIVRPSFLDSKIAPLPPMPGSLTFYNNASYYPPLPIPSTTIPSAPNSKTVPITYSPPTKIPNYNTFPSSFHKGDGASLHTSSVKRPLGIIPTAQTMMSSPSGVSPSGSQRRPLPSDRVSVIPLGPTPPRPSPSTSAPYSVGPNLPPSKPMPSAMSMPPPMPQNPPGVGLLKLAGCNIYGRMYRVGRIISELSGPCLECRCTEVGVQCRPLPC